MWPIGHDQLEQLFDKLKTYLRILGEEQIEIWFFFPNIMIGRLVTSMKRGKEGGGGREKEFLFEENKNFNNHVQYLPI